VVAALLNLSGLYELLLASVSAGTCLQEF